jgi:hypothetical protein
MNSCRIEVKDAYVQSKVREKRKYEMIDDAKGVYAYTQVGSDQHSIPYLTIVKQCADG